MWHPIATIRAMQMYTDAAPPHDSPADWRCPMCGVEVAHPYGPGRKRVYCSNACKQKAYRWRCANGVRLLVTPWTPAERSGARRAHAVRPERDLVAGRGDATGREVAVCGAFARRLPAATRSHTEFVPGAPRSCRSCTQLIGADPRWADDYPPGRVVLLEGRWSWVPNPLEQRRRDAAAHRRRAA